MEKGRDDEGEPLIRSHLIFMLNRVARATLARLHARGDIHDKFVVAQIEDMKADINRARDIGESRFVALVASFCWLLT